MVVGKIMSRVTASTVASLGWAVGGLSRWRSPVSLPCPGRPISACRW